MSADILASLQTFTDTQTLTAPAAPAQTQTDSQDGKFALLMSECIADAEETLCEEIQTLIPEAVDEAQKVITFTRNNSLAQSVINLLAGEPETPEAAPEEIPVPAEDSDVIWPEETDAAKIENLTTEIKSEVHKAAAKAEDFVSEKLQEAEPVISDAEEFLVVAKPKVLDRLPDSLMERLRSMYAEDVSADIQHEDCQETQPVVGILTVSAEKTAPESPQAPDKNDDESESTSELEKTPEDSQEVSQVSAELAGLAGVVNTQQEIQTQPEQTQPETPETVMQTQSAPVNPQPVRQVRAAKTEAQAPAEESPETSETPEVRTNFRDVLENSDAERENPDSQTQDEPQNQSQTQNFSQGRGESSSTRQRTDSRRVDSRTQTDRGDSDSAPTTRRTDSRSDFQSFFEGVLTSRRSVSRAQAEPMNIREPENFTQAATLRNGLTNVVRFIRADGVQKARVVVDPPALGRISVELTSGTSGVEASIKVASEQIRQLVQDQISQLRMNLSQQGVQVAEFTVDVQQDNSGNQNPHGQQQSDRWMNFFNDDEDDETEEFRVDLEDGLLYWVA